MTVEELHNYINWYNEKVRRLWSKQQVIAQWNYYTNVTDYNSRVKVSFYHESQKYINDFYNLHLRNFQLFSCVLLLGDGFQ